MIVGLIDWLVGCVFFWWRARTLFHVLNGELDSSLYPIEDYFFKFWFWLVLWKTGLFSWIVYLCQPCDDTRSTWLVQWMAILIRSVHHTGNWYTGDFFSARMWKLRRPTIGHGNWYSPHPPITANRSVFFLCLCDGRDHRHCSSGRAEPWTMLTRVGRCGGGRGSGVYVFGKKVRAYEIAYEFVDKAAQYARFPARLPPSKSKQLCNPVRSHSNSILNPKHSSIRMTDTDLHRELCHFLPLLFHGEWEKKSTKEKCRVDFGISRWILSFFRAPLDDAPDVNTRYLYERRNRWGVILKFFSDLIWSNRVPCGAIFPLAHWIFGFFWTEDWRSSRTIRWCSTRGLRHAGIYPAGLGSTFRPAVLP